MNAWPFRRQRQHLLILPDRLVEEPLTLIGLAGSLMEPHRVGGDLREFDHLEIGVVPEQTSAVVEHLRIVWVAPAHLERDRYRVAVASERCVGPLQVQANHPAQGGIG